MNLNDYDAKNLSTFLTKGNFKIIQEWEKIAIVWKTILVESTQFPKQSGKELQEPKIAIHQGYFRSSAFAHSFHTTFTYS